MKKLVLTGCDGENPVTVQLNQKSMKALYDLLSDFDSKENVLSDIFNISLLLNKMSMHILHINAFGELDFYVPSDYIESINVLDNIFNFFNHLKVSA